MGSIINLYTVKLVKETSVRYDYERKIKTPEDAVRILRTVLELQDEPVEKFGILALDTKNRVIGVHIISVGTLNSAMVHPREIFKAAILNNAASIICFHNHPSGDPSPSSEDMDVTRRVVESGKMLGIDVLDHVIIGDPRYVSLREMGCI